jgi:hypothetical protein
VTVRAGLLLAALLALTALSGCKGDPCDVVIYTYVDQIFSESPLEAFEKETGLKVCATYPSFETGSAS